MLKKYWVFRHPFKTLTIILTVAAICVLLFLYWLAGKLWSLPTCDYWEPNMTKEEKILIALKVTNNEIRTLTFEFTNKHGEKRLGAAPQVPYDDYKRIPDFYPDCCHVYSRFTHDTASPSEDLSHNDEGVVVLRYIGQYRDKNRNGEIRKAPIYSTHDLNHCKP